ncbi:MAG: hypothetical protein JHC90_02615 [Ilumatobacteraceae bacterium]|nr:hypothetical protein [Ilumatobacteraceae bacterium]
MVEETHLETVEPTLFTTRFVWVSALITFVVAAFVAVRIYGPSVRPDELGFLINGQLLIGRDETPLSDAFRSFYPIGFSFVTAFAALIGRTLSREFRITLFINFAFVALTAHVLSLYIRKYFALTRNYSRVVSIAVALMPLVAANALFAWSESLNILGFTALVYFAFNYCVDNTRSSAIALALIAPFLAVTHGRFTLVLPLTVMLLVIAPAVNKSFRRSVSTIVGAVILSALTYLLLAKANLWLRNELYLGAAGKEGRLKNKLFDTANWGNIVRALGGQNWYLFATSFGLVFVGALILLKHITTAERRERSGLALASLFTLGAVGVIELTSALNLVKIIRPDHVVYGRYSGVVSPILIAIALSALITSPQKTRALWWKSIALIPVLALFLILLSRADILHRLLQQGEFFARPNAIGLDWAIKSIKPSSLFVLSSIFVILAIAMYLIHRFAEKSFITFFVVVALFFTGYTVTQTVRNYRDYLPELVLDNEAINRGAQVVGFDTGSYGGQSFYDYRYLLHPVQARRFELIYGVPDDINCYIGSKDRPPFDGNWAVGPSEPSTGLILWVRDGLDSC